MESYSSVIYESIPEVDSKAGLVVKNTFIFIERYFTVAGLHVDVSVLYCLSAVHIYV